MLGTVVNTVAVVAGAAIGMLMKKGIPDRLADTLMKGIGLCTLFIGISGSLKGDSSLILILSIVIGALIGEWIDLEKRVNHLGLCLERRLRGKEGKGGRVAEGFVSASLVFCVGAMAIVGALQSGLSGNHEMLYNKSMLDFVVAIVFASTLGMGVMLAAGFVLVYQGTITLLAQWIAPFLNDRVIAQMTCVGSVIIIGLALNLLGITKLKVMNFVPAVFLPMLLCSVM